MSTVFVVSDQQTVGPEDRRTRELWNQRTIGSSDQRTVGPADRPTRGPSDQRTVGPADRRTRELTPYSLLDGSLHNIKYDLLFACETWLKDYNYAEWTVIVYYDYVLVRCDRSGG